MVCERPGGPIIDMWRDSHVKFPSNYSGDLPPRATRDELRGQMASMFQQRKFSKAQVEEALDFFEQYEERYYEVTEGERRSSTYHRLCGGAMVQRETGIFCAKCGKLPDLLPPIFMR